MPDTRAGILGPTLGLRHAFDVIQASRRKACATGAMKVRVSPRRRSRHTASPHECVPRRSGLGSFSS
ncbi:hypothetical protein [Lysobacter gummosus]|uniref:hypothetical protein n=1 Tax=Lysobacter gummosus TaxID=262324 RepID=UPI00362F9D51